MCLRRRARDAATVSEGTAHSAAEEPEVGGAAGGVTSTPAPVSPPQTAASSSKVKEPAAKKPEQPQYSTPLRPSVRQAPATVPLAREPLRLRTFERSLLEQLREHQTQRDQELMRMLTQSMRSEKEKELEISMLEGEVDRKDRELAAMKSGKRGRK